MSNLITILAPRWSTKDILVATWKVGELNQIAIEAKRKDGTFYYPEPIKVKGDWLRRFPTTQVNGRTMLVVPLSELDHQYENNQISRAVDNLLKKDSQEG